jgi:Cys-tRNA(Pro)/Cys-tRNA(Cys) deacylase
VFVIPANKELDLKKAAKCVVEKSISMVPKEEILTLTGYVKGGCSPVGMKKRYYTTFDISVKVRESIIISAGKIGYQVELDPQKLIQLLRAGIADVIVES